MQCSQAHAIPFFTNPDNNMATKGSIFLYPAIVLFALTAGPPGDLDSPSLETSHTLH